jgi:aconitate hydratase
MSENSLDSLNTRRTLNVNGNAYHYYSLPAAEDAGIGDVGRLPVSLKILLENLLRFEDNDTVKLEDIKALGGWAANPPPTKEIAFRPARVLMQDFTGVPAVADLAAMRGAVVGAGLDPELINPLSPVDLVIDHSVMVDHFGSPKAFAENVEIEMARNTERYRFLRWGQQAFDNFRVVPPGTGICHQVNLEFLAKAVWTRKEDGTTVAYPDTVVGTDSHTTMINGLGVLGWGVGGIEAEAAMLGQPISMLIPEVIGFKLTGGLADGITATDLVLRVVEMLREKGVVGKFVEFYGEGLDHLSLADCATIANMAPEYGATCGFFPIDAETISYLRLSGRDEETVALVEAYAKAQGMFRDAESTDPVYTDGLQLDLASVEPSLAGPRRPQDRVPMSRLKNAFDEALALQGKAGEVDRAVAVDDAGYDLHHGDVVIAAITSCTNTSNPAVMLGAGLVAKKALARGLAVKPWVKTSLAPGSKVVTEYLAKTGLQECLDRLGFNLVGYGCTTCIGNSGPLPTEISEAIEAGDLVVASVLSGNRNFEGRVHQEVRTNWLASPPLVVAYAIAGTTRINLNEDPIGQDADGNAVYLRDIWPNKEEVRAAVASVSAEMFRSQYADVFTGPEAWRKIEVSSKGTYQWEGMSTYIKQPPFFSVGGDAEQPVEVSGARVLAVLGDSVTTDHISPAGAIQPDSPAGQYLQQNGVQVHDFNSYGSRRGNHEVMMRGTFANIRIRNEMVPGVEGGYTTHIPSGDKLSIYDAAVRYMGEDTPLVVFAGKEYGTGSSRDWAAKGTRLLGVKAVIAESFERIHRSNLIGMGVLPLEFKDDVDRKSLELTGREIVDIRLAEGESVVRTGQDLVVVITREGGEKVEVAVTSRLDTDNEIAYFRAGGILQYVLNNIVANA